MGLPVHFSSVLQSLYFNVRGTVRVNSSYTDWFPIESGVKQGCLLSPLLFDLYVNDLAFELKNTGGGVNVGNEKICTLMYADDVVIIGDSEADLQNMLQVVNNWCMKWQMVLNQSKTNVVHFRSPSRPKTGFKFSCGDVDIDITTKYKYLGLWFNEHMDLSVMAKALADSAGRALGVLIAKYKAIRGMPLPCFRTLYDGMVSPILEYGSAIWGLKEFSFINAVHNRACRLFLRVRRHSPNLAIQAELGW